MQSANSRIRTEFDAVNARVFHAKKALNRRLSAARNAGARAEIEAESRALSDEWFAAFLALCRGLPPTKAELPSERDARLSKENPCEQH